MSGSGPAGVATAIGLAGHGYAVTLLAGDRPRPRLEGVSPRTRDTLEQDGCPRAAALAGAAPVERFVSWGALRGDVNRECLVDRARFDDALRDDARAAGVDVVDQRLEWAARDGTGWSLRGRNGRHYSASYWVDARGRAAPRGRAAQRGVATLAVSRPCELTDGPTIASALIAGPRGFFWAVARSDAAVLQWFRDPPGARRRGALAGDMDTAIEGLREGAEPAWITGLRIAEAEPLQCRDATPYRVRETIGAGWLRVGDAAAASDPLSGQGVWSALAMARAGVACARTELERAADAPHAERFYRERVASIHRRDQRKGRDFYREETRWCEAPFWARRSADEPEPAAPETAVETRPVLRDGLIEARRVLVTAAHPEGVWLLGGVPVVELLESGRAPAEELARRFGVSPTEVERARSWLRAAAPTLSHDPAEANRSAGSAP